MVTDIKDDEADTVSGGAGADVLSALGNDELDEFNQD